MKSLTSPKLVDWWTHAWAQWIGTSSARHVVKGCRSVRGILGISSWRDLYFIQVSGKSTPVEILLNFFFQALS